MTPVVMYSHSACPTHEQIVSTKPPDVLKLVLSSSLPTIGHHSSSFLFIVFSFVDRSPLHTFDPSAYMYAWYVGGLV